jgi:hypothetical protein
VELYYVVQNAAPPPRRVLCERAAAAGGFWLYRYKPRYGIIDDGYAKDLGELKYNAEVRLVRRGVLGGSRRRPTSSPSARIRGSST